VGFKNVTKTVAAFGGPLPPVPAEGEQSLTMISLQKAGSTNETHSSYGAYAQSRCRKRLRTTASSKDGVFGNCAPSTVNLQQPDSSNNEDNLAGKGTLGSFTFRNVRAIENSPTPSSTCSGPNTLYFADPAGAGVFRFQHGSLLKVTLTQGGDCIDFAADEGHCTLSLQITGGTGRFKNASGTLTLTETSVPVLADALHNPVFFADTGEFTGTVSGVSEEQGQGEEQ